MIISSLSLPSLFEIKGVEKGAYLIIPPTSPDLLPLGESVTSTFPSYLLLVNYLLPLYHQDHHASQRIQDSSAGSRRSRQECINSTLCAGHLHRAGMLPFPPFSPFLPFLPPLPPFVIVVHYSSFLFISSSFGLIQYDPTYVQLLFC